LKEISHVIITTCNIHSWEDTLAKRLENAKITIDGQVCGTMFNKVKDSSPDLEEKIVCPAGTVGSKVRIQSAKTDEYLHLAEIEVYYFKNSKYDGKVALINTTSSSQLNAAAIPANAIDGNNMTYFALKTCSNRKSCKRKKITTTDAWCNSNCNHKPAYCPKSFCACSPSANPCNNTNKAFWMAQFGAKG